MVKAYKHVQNTIKLNLAQMKITKDFTVNSNAEKSTEFAPVENVIKQILDETKVILMNS